MREVQVELGERSYPVHIGVGALGEIGSALRAAAPADRAAVITDDNVGPLYGATALASLRAAGFDCELITVPAGEESKSTRQAGELYDRLAEMKIERGSPLVALGGGVVGDLTGLVAATWVRGVPFVQVPTTIEAAVDASVGGKTGVNHPSGKNMIGAFYQPRLVQIDPACFDTLDARDVAAGLAESIKHGLIRDADFFALHEKQADALLKRDPDVLIDVLEKNVRIKAAVVADDEREVSGVRAHLNFGHTAGHAIEARLGYTLRHGECVGLGMIVAAGICRRLRLLENADADRIRAAIGRFGLPTVLPQRLDPDRLWESMQHDKKVAGGKIRWVLLDGIGKVVVRDDVRRETVLDALAEIQPS